jgi:methyl-accepting chemotaxis protein
MADTLQQRLDFMGLGQGAEAQLSPIAQSVAHHLDLALERVALQVAGAPSAARFLFGRERIEGDGGGPAAHWRALAAGQWDRQFADAAMRAGQRQARIGVDPRWHAGSHAIVAQCLVRGVIRDGVEAALRRRRGPLAMLVGDPTHVLEVTEAMADGLATLVSAVVLDLDLTFSGYAERLRLDAEAALATERGRTKRLVAEAARVLELAAQGQRDAGADALLADADLAPLLAGAERLADRMADLVEDLTVSGRAARTLAAEVLRCARLLGTEEDVQAEAAARLAQSLSALQPKTRQQAELSADMARKAKSGARIFAKARVEIEGALAAMEAAQREGDGMAAAIERADALGLAANVISARLAQGTPVSASERTVDEDLRSLVLGLSQLAAQLRVAQDKARQEGTRAGTGLEAALSLIGRLGEEQGEVARGLNSLEREAQRVAALISDGAMGAAGLVAAIERDRGQGAAIEETLREALEGAKALIDLAQAMGGAETAFTHQAEVPEAETAMLAAHWHVL